MPAACSCPHAGDPRPHRLRAARATRRSWPRLSTAAAVAGASASRGSFPSANAQYYPSRLACRSSAGWSASWAAGPGERRRLCGREADTGAQQEEGLDRGQLKEVVVAGHGPVGPVLEDDAEARVRRGDRRRRRRHFAVGLLGHDGRRRRASLAYARPRRDARAGGGAIGGASDSRWKGNAPQSRAQPGRRLDGGVCGSGTAAGNGPRRAPASMFPVVPRRR